MKEERSVLGLSTIRRNRGISLEQIAQSTKISVRSLEAIETGDFHKLPGGITTLATFASMRGQSITTRAPFWPCTINRSALRSPLKPQPSETATGCWAVTGRLPAYSVPSLVPHLSLLGVARLVCLRLYFLFSACRAANFATFTMARS